MITAALLTLRRLASGVPVWAWVLVAALAWGAWQRHRATSAADTLRAHDAAISTQIIQRQQADQAETARRLKEQADAIAESQDRARRAGVDAAGARAAAQRLRSQLASRAAHPGPADPASADGSEANQLADLLGQCGERYQQVAAVADAAIIAGLTCQRAYQALTTTGPPNP